MDWTGTLCRQNAYVGLARGAGEHVFEQAGAVRLTSPDVTVQSIAGNSCQG